MHDMSTETHFRLLALGRLELQSFSEFIEFHRQRVNDFLLMCEFGFHFGVCGGQLLGKVILQKPNNNSK